MWYCLQGSDIQPGDGNFIKKLLEVYTTYSIPIIFVHTQTYSKRQSNTCKSGVEKYLKEIYKNDNDKVQEHLNNYIIHVNILAREDLEEKKEAFGLNELEIMTKKEIKERGLKSAYFELIKKDIYPILINAVFNLVFSDNNLKKLKEDAMENLDKYLIKIEGILINDNLGLNEETKKIIKSLLKQFILHLKMQKMI